MRSVLGTIAALALAAPSGGPVLARSSFRALFLCNAGLELCPSPETSGFNRQVAFSSGFQLWELPGGLSEEPEGNKYLFQLALASSGTTTFRAELLVGGDVVAATGELVASSPTFTLFRQAVVGSDPVLTGTETVQLRIQHLGGSTGHVLWGDLGVDESFVSMPERDLGLLPIVGDALALADHDGDGDLDLAIAGSNSVRIYRQEVDGSFTDLGLPLPGAESTALAWSDPDRDGDLDLVYSGRSNESCPPNCFPTFLVRNDGQGGFVAEDLGLEPHAFGAFSWGDSDLDGDVDLALAGVAGGGVHLSQLVRNDGATSFTPLEPGWVAVGSDAAAEWADWDRDGDLDLALAGDTGTSLLARLYRNDGANVFQALPFEPVGLDLLDLAWGDADGDGDLDLALCGIDAGDVLALQLYRNDGAGSFSPLAVGMEPVDACDLAWGDWDADGDSDLLVVGRGSGSVSLSRLYRNLGGNTFLGAATVVPDQQFAAVAVGDLDGDGRLDVVLGGLGDGTGVFSGTFAVRNPIGAANTPPAAPAGLVADVAGGDVVFSWQVASDAETPSAGLSYELRVGSAPGGVDVVAPPSDPATGYRRLPARGPLAVPGAVLLDLPAGRYYWSVQAVDAGFAGSPFAPEATFTTDRCLGDDALGDADGDGFCAGLDCDDADPGVGIGCSIFADGFESGDVSAW